MRQEGLELHAWMFTMMRGENVTAHPEWYAVSRSGVSTAVKPPYVDYYKFMCPSRAEVRAYLGGVVRELASVDGLSSIHLDYIRIRTSSCRWRSGRSAASFRTGSIRISTSAIAVCAVKSSSVGMESIRCRYPIHPTTAPGGNTATIR